MLRTLLEARGLNLNDNEFAVVMQIVTDDIKFNRTSFGKKTNKAYVLDIAVRSANIFKRCALKKEPFAEGSTIKNHKLILN